MNEISPQLRETLRAQNPALLRQLDQIAKSMPTGGIEMNLIVKEATASEQETLNALVSEMNESGTTPQRRGQLARAALKLRGLNLSRPTTSSALSE